MVIAGAGVIGASTAYHLAANHGMRCTLYDQKGAGCAASGKAGGFLALDWCDGSPVGELARVSFAMHEELAKTLSLDSYRRLTCEAVAVDERAVVAAGGVAKPGNKKLESIEWADIGAVASRPMGTEETIAQVHPKRLTEAFLDAANAKAGTEVVLGKVEGVVADEVTGEVTGVVVDGETVPADVVVVAMGPWTHRASTWAPGMPKVILGQKYHAVLMRPERVLTQAVFFQGLGDPEFYPRGDGDVYVCAYPDSPNVVDEEPGEVEVRPDAVQRLVDVARGGFERDEKRQSERLAELSPSDHPGRHARHGRGAGNERAVRGDGALVLGDTKLSGVGGGDGGADSDGFGDVREEL